MAQSNHRKQMIPGLYYYSNFLSAEEEKTLLDFLDKEEVWFSVSRSANARQVLHYGYVYNYASHGKLEKAPEFPAPVQWLKQKILEKHPLASEFCLDQCIVNKYQPGQGIASHTDSPLFKNFICCVTIGSGASMDFSKNGETKSLFVEPRSLYIMSDEARYDWQHGMKSRKSDNVDGVKIKRETRFSLTFRTVAE